MADPIQDFYDYKVIKNVKQKGTLGYLFNKLNQYETHRYEVVLKLLKNKQFNSYLDIGCNEGDLAERVSQLIHAKKIFGIDVSQKAIKKCQNKFPKFKKNFSIQNVDYPLKFKSQSFDLITIIATLEHVFDPLAVVKEISRISKKGSTLIIEVPNIAFIKYRLNLLLGKRPRTSWDYGWDGGHLQLFTQKDLKKLLRKNNFKVEAATGSGIFLGSRKWWSSLLLSNIIIKAKKI
jgi:methionine biosynthesis protein MetW